MSDTATKRLHVISTEHATIVEFANPDAKNVIDDAFVGELHAALDAADERKVLAFRGVGSGFSSGRPHSSTGHPGGPGGGAQSRFMDVVRMNARVAGWKAPTIALVHGFAHGAALGLTLQCDIAIAESGTIFSFPEITYNLPPGLVASYLAAA